MPASPQTDIERRLNELLAQLTLKEKIAFLSGIDNWRTAPVERLGIPSLTMTDGPHGVRTEPVAGRIAGSTTAFPTGVSMAASWNVELIERVGVALARETRAKGADILLGPCVNIVRTPLAGRNFEAYSEDPYLNGRIGVAWVNGLQSQKVGASLKHYAANNHEIERNRGSSEVDERTLREIYLPHFETVVKEAQPWTVMCSYNRINGVYASQHDYLLNQILKGEWGFEGFVVSDWGANHTITESVAGGLDIEMPGPAKYYGRLLMEAVSNWQIDEATIDRAVRRILHVILHSGKMDGAPLPAGAVNTPEHQTLARELAEEAITLLKNDGSLLPLNRAAIKTIAVIGPNAAGTVITGGGSSTVEPPQRITALDGLRAKAGPQINIEFETGADNFEETPVIALNWLKLPDDSDVGLRGEFFRNADFAGSPESIRNERRSDFWWFIPAAQNAAEDRVSVRWTGTLTVPESGRYKFELRHMGACRLSLDDQLLLTSHAPDGPNNDESIATATAQLDLAGGQAHTLKIEYLKYVGQTVIHYRLGLAAVHEPGHDERLTRAAALARRADVALVFVGMPEGFETEGWDRPHMNLTGGQDELVRAVAAANPRTVVVLNVGSPVSMPWLASVPAVVLAHYPGMEGGNAIANVLFGEVNPSGKLPVTFPHRIEDTPAYPNTSHPGQRAVVYGEGLFVGYRHYDFKDVTPLFPFGHGLSYTTFEYGKLHAPATAKAGESIQVTLTVKNSGARAGKEVVQVYMRDVAASVARPPKELKGFHKLSLQPGETQTVTFTLDERAFAFYDAPAQRWVVEPGQFEILAGSSSRDVRARATITLQPTP